jgi:hypothetical protein
MGKEQDADLKSAYTDTLAFINGMLDNYDAVVVGAVMLSLTLSLYKTVLPSEDFDLMVDAVAETKDSIKPFTPPREMMQ